MLSTVDLFQLKVRALDGDVGSVRDLIFDEADWTVRHLVIDSGGWVFGRRIVIDPEAVHEPDALAGLLRLDLTREQMKALPDAPEPSGSDAPEGILQLRMSDTLVKSPDLMLLGGGFVDMKPDAPVREAAGRVHSVRAASGYDLLCGEDKAGKLVGFLVDPVAWDLPIALVQTTGSESLLLLPTRLIEALSDVQRAVVAKVDAATLAGAPAYDERIQDERVYLPVVTDYYAGISPAA